MSKSIELATAQNVIIEYELASLRERMMAFGLDFFAFTSIYVMLMIFLSKLGQAILGDYYFIMVWMMYVILLLCYFFVMEVLNGGQTLGKKLLDIKVIRLDGKEPNWGDYIIRAFLQCVDSLFCFGIIGVLLIKTTANSQRLGDMASNTTVIKNFSRHYAANLENILSIHSLGTYTPVYPQVRNMTERDMIFIKNALLRFQNYHNVAHANALVDLSTHLCNLLDIKPLPTNHSEFLKTLLKDYVVLTR